MVLGSGRVASVNPGSALPQCSFCVCGVAPGPRGRHLSGLESMEGLLCVGFWRALCSKTPRYFRGLLRPVKGLRLLPYLQAMKLACAVSWALAGDTRCPGSEAEDRITPSSRSGQSISVCTSSPGPGSYRGPLRPVTGASRGQLFRRAAWSLRSADLLSWAVSLLISALEGEKWEGGTLCNMLDCSQACPMLQGITVSVFQGNRKMLQDPLGLTGYRRQAGLRFCHSAPLLSSVSRVCKIRSFLCVCRVHEF